MSDEFAYYELLSAFEERGEKIAALEAHNKLLREVVMDVMHFRHKVGSTDYTYTSQAELKKELQRWRNHFTSSLKAAIDGGALASQWQQTTDKILDERHELWQQLADSDGGAMGDTPPLE